MTLVGSGNPEETSVVAAHLVALGPLKLIHVNLVPTDTRAYPWRALNSLVYCLVTFRLNSARRTGKGSKRRLMVTVVPGKRAKLSCDISLPALEPQKEVEEGLHKR